MSTLYYEVGFGRKIAAEKASIAPDLLNSLLYRNHIPSHCYNKALTPAQIETVKLNRQLGKTYNELAQMYGMSSSTMRRYCIM